MTDMENNAYFRALPSWVRESVMQSGVSFKTEDELRRFVENLETSGR